MPPKPGPRHCLVIDQGTHASRAVIIDEAGRSHGQWFQEVSLRRIDQRRVEQDADEILASVETVIERATANGRVDCVALATQRSTVVAWDRHQPLTPALSWQDSRAYEYLESLDAQRVTQITGLRPSPHNAASKLRWLLEHVPAVGLAHRDGCLFMGPLASFLLWHLSDSTDSLSQLDHANAARSLLFNLETCDWDPWLLAQFRLPIDALPRCRPVRDHYGILRGTKAVITCVSGDQTAALHAGGKPDSNTAYVNLGTGAFVLVPTGTKKVLCNGLLCGLADSSKTDTRYCIEGTVNGAGAALAWAADQWQIPELTEKLNGWLKDKIDPPLFLNTVGGLGSPYWQPGPAPQLIDQDGAVLIKPSTPAAGAVAVAESILFLLMINLNQIRRGGWAIHQIQVSGGLAQIDHLCQRLADLSGLPVVRPNQTQATAHGAAWLALGRPDSWALQNQTKWFEPATHRALERRYNRFVAMIDP